MGDSEKSVNIINKADCEESLESLLDSALSDFNRPLPKVTTNKSVEVVSASRGSIRNSCGPTNSNQSKNSKQFGDASQAVSIDQIPQASSVESKQCKASMETSNDFSKSIEETMKALAGESQSGSDPSTEELAQLFNLFALTGESSFQNEDQLTNLMPFMENVMQNLLSKEFLYPAIKDIVSRYPKWLTENKQNLDTKMFQNYSCQCDLMKKICEEFETNHEASEDTQANSFEKVLGLLQKLQEYGNPPKDLIGDLPPDLPFSDQTTAMHEQCLLM